MEPTREAIKAQLDNVLSSRTFQNAGRASRFLSYILEKELSGQGAQLKEQILGIEVFERAAGFDSGADAIVRVEAGRLRSKLKSYYEDQGRNDPVIIDIPKGGYRPEFKYRASAAPTGAGENIRGQEAQRTPPLSAPAHRKKFITLGGLAAVLLILAAWAFMPVLDDKSLADYRASDNGSKPKILVLPFVAYSDTPAVRELADRFTEKVTFELARIGDVRVVPSSSALQYKGSASTPAEIARDLQADILLLARLVGSEERIAIEVVLVDTGLDEKFWVGDGFTGQDPSQIAGLIASAVNEQILAKRRPNNP